MLGGVVYLKKQTMILKQTDDYTLVIGTGLKLLLKNNTDNRYEVWVRVKPGSSNLIWCFFETSSWYIFDHVATNQEVLQGNTI